MAYDDGSGGNSVSVSVSGGVNVKRNPSVARPGRASANEYEIIFTDAAKAHIRKKLMEVGLPATTYFRLSLKKTGCSGYMYVPEIVTEKKSSDLEIKETDFIIYLDSETASLMQGTQVDYVKKNLGVSQLEFKHPRAKNMCGCGESFTIE